MCFIGIIDEIFIMSLFVFFVLSLFYTCYTWNIVCIRLVHDVQEKDSVNSPYLRTP